MFIVIRMPKAGGLTPSRSPAVHVDAGAAKAEAKRLAEVHPGDRFFVFEDIGHAHVREPIEWNDGPLRKVAAMAALLDDAIPF